MDILITENIVGDAVEQLRQRWDVEFQPQLWKSEPELQDVAGKAQALIVRNQTQVNRELLENAPNLKIVARAGVGLDNIDLDAANDCNVLVTYTPNENTISVAELTLAAMLSLARRIPAADQHVKRGGWDRQAFTGSELYKKTIGILGLGRIGYQVALRAKAFGMTLVAHDPFVSASESWVIETDIEMVDASDLLQRSHFVCCHLPATKQTENLVSQSFFKEMRSDAFFINMARGQVVDEVALMLALEQDEIAGAALDVREQEPPGTDDPLSQFPNVLLTPHIGAFTVEAQERVVSAVCSDVDAVLSGTRAPMDVAR